MVAHSTDGNGMVVDQINHIRERNGVAPLQISIPLREIARKYIRMPSIDGSEKLFEEARNLGYFGEGLRVRLDYRGSYTKVPGDGKAPVSEPEMADIIAKQLIKEWPTLLRPDWQHIGIATTVSNIPTMGGLNFHAEFVIGWKILWDAPRPAHFPPPPDHEGNPIVTDDKGNQQYIERELDAWRGPVYQEPSPKFRRRWWWPFGS